MSMPNGQSMEPEVVEVDPGRMLSRISRDEIEMQVSTAHKFPRFSAKRGIAQFQQEVLTLATVDEDVARSMFYRLERRSKNGKSLIEGPTIRMAEIVVSCWRNIHASGRPGGIEDNFVIGQAVAWDLETNVKVGMETRRRITDRFGQRYNEDMIVSTANAAVAIAFRNAALKVVPSALVKKAFEEAKQVSLGKGLTLPQRRDRAFKAMLSVGAKPAEILRVLERRSELDITVEDLITLNGLYTAIKDNETTWAQVLADFEASQPRTEDDIKRDLKTELDDVEIVADRVEEGPEASSTDRQQSAGPSAGGIVVAGSELKAVKALLAAAPGTNAEKTARIKAKLPYYAGAETLRQADMEIFTSALQVEG